MKTANNDTDTKVEHALEFLAKVSVWELSRIADCASPDSATSAGADLLDSIRVNLIDFLQHDSEGIVPVLEIADASVTVYTHAIWLTFVDLCAYNEDLSAYMALGSTMTEQAQYVLVQVAERVLTELCTLLELEMD